jgi:hypothetical protein
VTPQEQFDEFHAENPHVYDELVRSARSTASRPAAKCGMSLLFGRVRWVLALRTEGDAFKLNNNYAPFYSRLIMAQEPDLAGMFDLRRSYADEAA